MAVGKVCARVGGTHPEGKGRRGTGGERRNLFAPSIYIPSILNAEFSARLHICRLRLEHTHYMHLTLVFPFAFAGHIMQQAPSGAVPTVHQTISPTFQEAQVATQPEAVVTMATTQIIAGNGEIQFANAQAVAQFEADKRAVYRYYLIIFLLVICLREEMCR